MIKVSLPTEPQQRLSDPPAKKRCTHSRLVEAVVNTQGNRTGELLCMECKALFPDPKSQQPVH